MKKCVRLCYKSTKDKDNRVAWMMDFPSDDERNIPEMFEYADKVFKEHYGNDWEPLTNYIPAIWEIDDEDQENEREKSN